MQFSRQAAHDDRRRRLVAEEAAREQGAPSVPGNERANDARHNSTDSGTSAGDGSSNSAPSAQGRASPMEQQPRITDLVPRRHLAFVVWFVIGLLMIAGLEFLYYSMPHWSKGTTDGKIAAFDLDCEGSLGTWFSSFLLLAASGTAWLVYAVRRHRADDYQGRYRVWLWAALMWLLMSIDESSSLHEGFKELMASMTGERFHGDGSIWWVGAYMVLLAAIGLTLWLDMECFPSRVCFFLTGVSWATAVVFQLGWCWPNGGAKSVMVEEGCEMFGYLLLWLTMALQARHVIWEAEGKTRRRKKTAKGKTKRDKDGDGRDSKEGRDSKDDRDDNRGGASQLRTDSGRSSTPSPNYRDQQQGKRVR